MIPNPEASLRYAEGASQTSPCRYATCCAILLLALFPGWYAAQAQSVEWLEEDAEVWAQQQVVRGAVADVTAEAGTLWLNDEAVPFSIAEDTFEVSVALGEGENVLVAEVEDGETSVLSDTLRLTLGYVLRPETSLEASVSGQTVTLEGRVLANPDSTALTFAWEVDPDNPAGLTLSETSDTTATMTVPAGAPEGEYYVNLTVTDADGDAFRARTFVTADADSLYAFDIRQDHAAWVDRAILYGIAPRYFAYERLPGDGKLEYITARIEELTRLGITALWIQPITNTEEWGQAYDVIDYFGIWPALGDEDDLRLLIETAHEHDLKVLFDFVPNHTSLAHPYAKDAIAHGARSHYYDFYMREKDDAPYSENYNVLQQGEMTFIYYFWDDLVTLNYDNPEVQRFIIEASRYWIEAFDIDGYRIDAVWGVLARNPEFVEDWRLALKRVKPEVFLLGETKATNPAAFDGRFDAAYDWTDNPEYISEWSWARGSEERTIFNSGNERFRTRDLRNALTNDGDGYHPDAKILRYLQNNDTPSFMYSHTAEQMRMASALLFSLPGIPLVYYSQEIARSYDTYGLPSFHQDRTIASYDEVGMYPYYQHLILLRKSFPALYSEHYEEVSVEPAGIAGHTFAYRRWTEDEPDHAQVFGIINMADEAVQAELMVPVEDLGLDAGTTYYLTDMITGEHQEVTVEELAAVPIDLDAYTTRLFALADEVVTIPTAAEPDPAEVPNAQTVLAPNYPNPFQDATTITFDVSTPQHVRLTVYDLLGREVAVLTDGLVPAGRQDVTFDGRALPSGLYIYRLQTEHRTHTRSMLLVK